MNTSTVSKRLLAIILLLFFILSAQATIVAFKFDDADKEARFKQFSEELRCLVCQNQSLADSNAELAMDLRRELYKMIQNDATDEQIVSFMVDRYGDFVLYKPPVKPSTWLLWFGPFILVVIGLIILFRVIRSTGKQEDTALSAEEQKKLDILLENEKEEPRS
ncbi:Cytochrome c heme lyase subunit CcmL [hydrothermal vent metagenome]|uniref:Cytochrome c heme lyase subunit CcmL n=1 Tax=hydrothermal vent metagenome TaxID=652676 RepID=A0A3B1BLZ0_9ZZZZ